MLERMRRETSRREIEGLIKRLRQGLPGVTLRTTFIVGFPGETDACFRALTDFIRQTRFERLGVFTYSREAGTRAAQMSGQVPDRVKRRRRDEAMATQREVARQVAAAQVGRTLRVLVERPAADGDLEGAAIRSWEHGDLRRVSKAEAPPRHHYRLARGEADAPDIDGRVYVRGRLPLGAFATVRVVGHTDYDLLAEPV
jgi:ribosomal protein S12 methylthiotransferase